MWVYLDDSGDGSTKPGATSHLTFASCVFTSKHHVEHARKVMDKIADDFGINGEFKFSKTSKTRKQHFFEQINQVKFAVRAIVIDKSRIRARKYRENPHQMKALGIAQLLDNGFGTVVNAKVFIDGQDTKAFGIPDSRHFLSQANQKFPGTVREVNFVDSRKSRFIQLADMHAGAINSAVRTDKDKRPQYLEMFRRRTFQSNGGTLWHFK